MNLTINGKSDAIDRERLSILELLQVKEVVMPHMVSVQLNGRILRHAAFDSTYVSEGDAVEFLYFIGGG